MMWLKTITVHANPGSNPGYVVRISSVEFVVE